ncbi:MAG: ABC transporter ATP-binding protein [Lachnospiraceae bacterium]|nr:ABC transporter ATP-binding protein [Lachnospiraceae bacterium]
MIKTEKLTKSFEDFTALSDVSCTIPDGCIYGMVGSNGAGKSTFLRLLSGVYRPDDGQITIDNMPVFENSRIKKQIAFIPDDLFFLPGSNMKRMADFYSSIYESFDKDRFNTLTEAFNLNPSKNINTFSKGMKRQVAIILALSSHPKYMFFDETFDGLDPVMRNLVKGLICKDVIDNNTTTIITSHSLRELEDICDQLSLLHKGGLILESDIEGLKTSHFKVQIAFSEDYDTSIFAGIPYMYIKKQGSVTNMIVTGDYNNAINRLKSMNPILMDILPLSLEEVFTYEMQKLGYNFDEILNEESNYEY